MIEFCKFEKMGRLKREMVVTEKIDGTNAQVLVVPVGDAMGYSETGLDPRVLWSDHQWAVLAGSRKRFVTPDEDNFGWAAWVQENAEELAHGLGEGRHFGEWWGSGIQRGYGLSKGVRRFSLFNAGRWKGPPGCVWQSSQKDDPPACCDVVPILYRGGFSISGVEEVMEALKSTGSFASLGFMDPEGVIVYLVAAKTSMKVTFENDKGKWGAS